VRPLRVTAEMVSRVMLSPEPLHLDALLMAAVARRDGLPPLTSAADAIDAPPLDIPIALSECGRYYLASAAIGDVVSRENRFIQRRFPLQECITRGSDSIKRIALTSGTCKSFRVPAETQHMPTIVWYAVGDEHAVRELLGWVTRIGRRRGVGEGLVREWRVEQCESWQGFPVILDGRPLRHMPVDVPGIESHVASHGACVGRCRPPYWLHHDETDLAVL
jgi:CRISPR type IV-associated protein Csf3